MDYNRSFEAYNGKIDQLSVVRKRSKSTETQVRSVTVLLPMPTTDLAELLLESSIDEQIENGRKNSMMHAIHSNFGWFMMGPFINTDKFLLPFEPKVGRILIGINSVLFAGTILLNETCYRKRLTKAYNQREEAL